MDKNRIIDEFDANANEYESNRLGDWYIAQLRRLIQHIGDSMSGDFLDIGCGTGWLLRSLAAAQPDRRFVGVDISPKMIATARLSLPANASNVEFIAADWEATDLQRLSSYGFSEVVCTSAFHYFARPGDALSRMHDVLAEDGSLYLIERDKSASPLTVVWDLLHRHYIKDHVRFYSSADLRSMLGEAGFLSIEVIDAIRRYFWHGKLQTNIVLIRGQKVQA